MGFTMNDARFHISSPAFESGKAMPSKFAMKAVTGGKNISIPLVWENIPPGTKSFAVSIVDLHPIANKWVHWIIVDIPPPVTSLTEGASMSKTKPPKSREFINSFGEPGYGGPQPPKGSGVHKYEITVYALNVDSVQADIHSSLEKFKKALEGKVIGSASMIGLFER